MPKIDLAALQLAPQHLTALQALLAEFAPQLEVWAYGSRVHGGAHEGSDLDLVLRQPQALQQVTGARPALQLALQESDLPILVDVLDWAELPPSFQQEIERAYIVLQEASAGA